MKQVILFVLAMCISFAAFAQMGTVRGLAIDDNTGEELAFADVVVEGTDIGVSTDLDGTFSISLDPGVYSITISYVGYANYTVSDVTVTADEVNNLGTLRVTDEATDLGIEIVVEAKVARNSDNALLTIQRKSPNVVDAISSQSFSRVGDGDAAAAIKRVTGVSIEGGKHVFVRGLGDRYTKTLLNGMTIPGLDPDKNSVQMDIFPTNLLDNIMVFKTFSPNLPGDFTGGTVDIALKDFPEEETFNVSLGLGYNPRMNFKGDFLTYEGGKLDWIGFDDGKRALPFSENANIPSEVDARSNDAAAERLIEMTKGFNPQMGAEEKTSSLNTSFSLSYGNQINKEKATFGYTVAANYSNGYEHYTDVVLGRYVKPDFNNVNILESFGTEQQSYSDRNVLWSALAAGALKFNANKFKLGVFRSQNGTTRTSQTNIKNGEENPATLVGDYLEYVERSVTNFFVGGEHKFGKGKMELDWTFAPTISGIDEPDNRYTIYELREDQDGNPIYLRSGSVGGEVIRVYRNLSETNYSSKMDFSVKIRKEDKVRVGFSNTYKLRDYYIKNYTIDYQGGRTLTGNPDEFLAPGGIWSQDNTLGTSFVRSSNQAANRYDARQNTLGMYLMHEFKVSTALKFIYGLRMENFKSWYTGENAQNAVFDDAKLLDRWDALPSLSMVYGIVPNKMNLRASVSRTVARPAFREISAAQIQDRLSGVDFYGNLNVKTSNITNADIRWEYYMNSGEILAVSTFYKNIKDPIEISPFRDPASDFYNPGIIIPYNGGNTNLYGIEFEVRKSMDFISEALAGMSLGANVSFVRSQVEMAADELAIRKTWARDGEEVEDTRQLAGQAPYIVNAYLNYTTEDNATEANISYNVQGRRLMVVGLGNVPDLYENPFHGLNFKLSHKFATEDRWKASFSVNNILGQKRRNVFESFGTDDTTARLINPGTSFSLGFSYKII